MSDRACGTCDSTGVIWNTGMVGAGYDETCPACKGVSRNANPNWMMRQLATFNRQPVWARVLILFAVAIYTMGAVAVGDPFWMLSSV